jgi:DNA topoisomerase-2
MDLHEHILKRPDTYVGSLSSSDTMLDYTFSSTGFTLEAITLPSAFVRTFVEILSNAIDNQVRSLNGTTPCKHIMITIDEEGTFKVSNDGSTIPFQNESQEWIPEKIFGQLLTSSNYDDTHERSTSGRNGYGAKLTNIFSTKFVVTIDDGSAGRSYSQEWRDNMYTKDKPRIRTSKAIKKNNVTILWKPDYVRFAVDPADDLIRRLFGRYAYDASVVMGPSVQVSFQNQRITVKDMLAYSALYNQDPNVVVLCKTAALDIVVRNASGKAHQVSFVNGIRTKDGGVHADAVNELVIRPIMSLLEKKKISANFKDVKNKLDIFVQCTLPNPSFQTQSKDKLTSPKPKWSVEFDGKKMSNWPFITELKDQQIRKDEQLNKKTDSRRKAVRVDGLDSANLAGKKSGECTLILCEGLSAKTYAVCGIEKGWMGRAGRDYFGIYPLRGKLLNVRNAAQYHSNRELSDLKCALNLKHGADYTDDHEFATLNYAKVLIMTDADVDGMHIEGLILNFFDVAFPSLLKRPFIYSMKTPIVKVQIGPKQSFTFYDERMFAEMTLPPNAHVKYYKGLGTSTRKDVLDDFAKKVVQYEFGASCGNSLSLAFDQKRAGDRKQWIDAYMSNPNYETCRQFLASPDAHQVVRLKTFFDEQFVRYCVDDCQRSIPSIMDGLKVSQRKIIYSMRLKRSAEPVKVAQWAGYIAEKTHYKHGEQCLQDTIIKMAQQFVGSNNVCLVTSDGQFGSRLSGGKDAASGRYIYSKLESVHTVIFPVNDDPVLCYRNEENTSIEPVCYYPVVPFILVNGCTAGIGTGWSTFIPNYDIHAIIQCVRRWINNEPLTELTPFYAGFKGTITQTGVHSFQTTGIWRESKDEVHVSELPIGLWTDKYKAMLDEQENSKAFKRYTNNSTVDSVSFTIKKNNPTDVFDTSQLSTTIKTSNIALLDENDRVQTFCSVADVVVHFCERRLEMYEARKKYETARHLEHIMRMTHDLLFIHAVLDGKIRILHLDEDLPTVAEIPTVNGTYDHYTSMQVKQFTQKKVQALHDQLQSVNVALELLRLTDIRDLWRTDLTKLETEINETNKKKIR